LHRPELHQHLDQLAHRDAERLREVADGRAGLDRDRPGGRRDLARLPGRPGLGPVAGPLALSGAGTAAAALDHDAALPVARAAASSGSDGSTAWHRSSSVELRELGVHDHRPAQRSVEGTAGARTLEAGETAARVDAAAVARTRSEVALD